MTEASEHMTSITHAMEQAYQDGARSRDAEVEAFRAALVEPDRERPAAVIMDMIFPEGDETGAVLIEECGLGEQKGIPVVVVSVLDDLHARLRALLELRAAIVVKSMPAEILRESADLFSRRVVIDRGSTHGVLSGAPVIDDRGVLGQVTRVYQLNAEVTLLGDRDAAIPVLNNRTGARGAAFAAC
jgi:DNA-binding NarL/FixJ family response regulator